MTRLHEIVTPPAVTPVAAPTLAELLEPFRKETNTRAAAIATDDRAVRLLAAWSAFAVPPWSPPTTPAPADERQRWAWIWSGIKVDQVEAEHAAAAGVPAEIVDYTLRTLIALRLIYPDGTISDSGELLLLQRLDANTRKRPGGRK